MPELEFSIDNTTGETSMRIKGVRGKACKPIHDAVSRDLNAALGITELRSEDTAEMLLTESTQQTQRLRLQS